MCGFSKIFLVNSPRFFYNSFKFFRVMIFLRRFPFFYCLIIESMKHMLLYVQPIFSQAINLNLDCRSTAAPIDFMKGTLMKNLVKKARKKDPDAFTELIQSQMQNLYKTARAILYNDEDAADAISETILCCWEKLDQLREDQYFRTWITRILVNKCRDLLRKKEALNWTNEIPEIPENDSGFINAEWKEALNGLDEKYRLVLMLYYIEGFKTSEISQILEMPESTVRTRLARGRDQLSDTYREERRKTV